MDIIVTTVCGALVTGAIRLIQKYHPGISSRVLLISFAIGIGVGYQLFLTIVPQDVQQSIIKFVLAVLGTAVGIHEFIARPILDKEPPKIDKE